MTIAVAYDDNARSRAAITAAGAEAQQRGEDLAVIRVHGGVDQPGPESPEVTARVAEMLADYPGLEWSFHAGPEGFDTADALLDLADKLGATRLVLGIRKRRPVGKLILGSVAQRVILDAHIPVVIVKAS